MSGTDATVLPSRDHYRLKYPNRPAQLASVMEKPRRIFLDTAHLVNIARLRRGEYVPDRFRVAYAHLDAYIQSRRYSVIFSLSSPLDWVDGDATLESALNIAYVIDSSANRLFFEGDQFLFLHELLCECLRVQPGLRIPHFPIFQEIVSGKTIRTGLGTLVNEVPRFASDIETIDGAFPVEIPAPYAAPSVQLTWQRKQSSPATYHERVHGFGDALDRDIKGRPDGTIHRQDIHNWTKHFLKVDIVLRALNSQITVDEVIDQVDWDRCPAIQLYIKARAKRIRAAFSAKANDVDDWANLPIIPYCDLFLTDRAFREFILQADKSLAHIVHSDPRSAAEALGPCVP